MVANFGVVMKQSIFKKFDLGQIKPLGYLKRQLEVQAEGLSGHMPALMDEASDNSAWLGGKGDGWERGPYYVYGLLSLAAMLDSEPLLAEVEKWINKIIASARPDGMYGPEKNSDWWPRMVVNKLLCDYYEYKPQKRILTFLTDYYLHMAKSIDSRPFASWAWARGFEELISLRWLYGKTGDKRLFELANKMKCYSLDWSGIYADYPYKKASDAYMGKLKFNVRKVTFFAGDFVRAFIGEPKEDNRAEKILARNRHPFSVFYHVSHGVNIAMAFKYPAYQQFFFDDLDTSKKGYEDVMRYHGTAAGLYTCDEHVMGPSPVGGTELCTVVESMYSFEKLIELTGDPYWADKLELAAFSALPATFTYDMCAHQYVQQTNQVAANSAKRGWYDSYNNANIFGLKPNYACCLANMHQGFPKLTEHLSYLDGNKIAIMIPAPHAICTLINGEKTTVEVCGNYPYESSCVIRAKEGNPVVVVRKPGYAAKFCINGQEFTAPTAEFALNKGDTLCVTFQRTPKLLANPDGTYSVMLGSVLMALPISFTKRVKKQRGRFSDVELLPDSDWNYALDKNALEGSREKYTGMDCEHPYLFPPLHLAVKAHEIVWDTLHNSADTRMPKNISLEIVDINLVPYGATNLRISQFHIAEQSNQDLQNK